MKSGASRSLREKLVSEVEKYGFLKFGAEVGREDGVFDEEAGFFLDGTLGFESSPSAVLRHAFRVDSLMSFAEPCSIFLAIFLARLALDNNCLRSRFCPCLAADFSRSAPILSTVAIIEIIRFLRSSERGC